MYNVYIKCSRSIDHVSDITRLILDLDSSIIGINQAKYRINTIRLVNNQNFIHDEVEKY